MPKDLNLVLGATARLPVVISPRGQPSQFTVAPVFGLEGGYRWDSHPICEAVGTVSVTTTPECVPAEAKIAAPGPAGCPSGSHLISNTNSCTQPQEIFRRVAGVDASMRWPYKFTRNFFGDRPATLDFSYRVRWLSYAEPFYDATDQEKNPLQKAMALPEGQSLGSRYYLRATLIIPVSAYFQLRATWQRGSLPPLFQYVGSQVTLGLAFSNPGSSEH
jgi:hypothetical protein